MIKAEEHLGLVGMVARRYSKFGYEDVFQEGCVGLLRACEDYDESNGSSFSTFAVVWINGNILKYLRDKHKLVRIPSALFYDYGKIAKMYKKENISEVPVEEISEKTGLTIEEVENALIAHMEMFRIDKSCEERESYLETENVVLEYGLESAMKILKDKEKYVIEQRFIHDKTQQSIAKEMGVQQSIVSRLQTRALKKLRMELGIV